MEKAVKSPEATISKKLKNLIKGVVYLLRKSLSNTKLFLDFSTLLLKRTHKLITKLALIHPENDAFFGPSHYEFSCSNTPQSFFHIPANKRAKLLQRRSHAIAAAREVLELINGGGDRTREEPRLSVKENEEDVAVREVNEAADEFIKKFYKELRNQMFLALDSPYHDSFCN